MADSRPPSITVTAAARDGDTHPVPADDPRLSLSPTTVVFPADSAADDRGRKRFRSPRPRAAAAGGSPRTARSATFRGRRRQRSTSVAASTVAPMRSAALCMSSRDDSPWRVPAPAPALLQVARMRRPRNRSPSRGWAQDGATDGHEEEEEEEEEEGRLRRQRTRSRGRDHGLMGGRLGLGLGLGILTLTEISGDSNSRVEVMAEEVQDGPKAQGMTGAKFI